MELITGMAPIVQMASRPLGVGVGDFANEAEIGRGNFFARAEHVAIAAGEPQAQTGRTAVSAATRDLFTRPPRTMSAASRVSASVTRKPAMNSDFLPI